MILSCNSCKKKFVVPDSAITANGRLVQCSSCGNKWKQFPTIITPKASEKVSIVKPSNKIKASNIKPKKKKIKKRAGPNLYSPEYLVKKHGIRINDTATKSGNKLDNSKIRFGFYNYLTVLSIIIIFIFRILYFTQDIIIRHFPIAENYLNYLFETINNIKVIILNFIFG